MFTGNTRELQDQVVWYQGAAVAIDRMDRGSPFDPQFVLVARLLAMEDRLIGLQRILLQQLQNVEGLDVAVHYRAAVSAASAASSDLFEAVRDMRGAVQAFEADRSAMAQAHRVCATPADLDTELARIAG